ncbi:hypothetical protein KIN20_027068 [Parelaphostrongylus tenuis]|nr:hypothetical protein KIN20_027068 [Parelaphostrongylus tenuis]
MKLAIIRATGLTEIFMDENSRVSLYGSSGSVQRARTTIRQMFIEHGLGDAEIRPSSESLLDTSPIASMRSRSHSLERTHNGDCRQIVDMPRQYHWLMSDPAPNSLRNSNSQLTKSQSGTQSRSFSSMPSESFHTGLKSESSPHEPSGDGAARQISSIGFFVSTSDAPRLIGTRGATKRRIEDATGCTILLHTEKKQNGKFPVEVFSTSTMQCEIARQHILGFLAGTHSPAGRPIGSPTKNKEIHARPKMHLQLRPKKMPTK